MKIFDIVPFRKNYDSELARRQETDPFYLVNATLNRLFDDFGRLPSTTFNRVSSSVLAPRIDVAEGENEIIVTAELPGMEENEVELLLAPDTLTIKGEKKAEKEEKELEYYRSERVYGSFSRTFQLPTEIDREKVTASFKNGVLKVTLPKTAAAKNEPKKIEIKKG